MRENNFSANIIGGNNKGDRKESDFYPTPPDVTVALMEFLALDSFSQAWDPACGDGAMTDVLSKYLADVICSDIRETGKGAVLDFLSTDYQSAWDQWIITNPRSISPRLLFGQPSN